MNLRNTRQKKIIIDVLNKDKTHPTILELYEKINKIDSTIGQATIYRNVNKLVDEGVIRRLAVMGDVDHYDGDVSNHYHLTCIKCGRIFDIFGNDFSNIINQIMTKHKIVITNEHILFEGICESCLNKKDI